MNDSSGWGKLAYAALFTVAFPLALAAWAWRLDHLLRLPAPGQRWVGVLIAVIGAAFILASVVALRVYGGGWPMSPYPPARRVTLGPYAITEDPIYAGSVAMAMGIAVAVHSAAGIWIVTPVLGLACAAFVIGYERDATTAHFGARRPPLIRLPKAGEDAPSVADRLSVYLIAFAPWIVAYEAVNRLGIPADASVGYGPWDRFIPLLPWTEVFYFLAFPFALAVPLVARTARNLREFIIRSWIATTSVTAIYLLVPIVVVPRPAPVGSVFTPMLLWERGFNEPVSACPAFHVIWAALAASAFSSAFPRLRSLWWALAIAISASCLTTGMHSLADVLAAVFAVVLIAQHRRIWAATVALGERVANSWRDWNYGSVRLMIHGVYAGLGAFFGIVVIVTLAGERSLGAALFIGVATVGGAALWAQTVEGSAQLLRPFGFYGGIIGGGAAIALTRVLGVDPMLMLAATSVAAPAVQAFGRIRCLVQGCCHGRATSAAGIRYHEPHSRVVRLTSLGDVPLHPTQLYSIVWSLFTAAALARLWIAGAPLSLIAGAFFILNGLGRFVEEHFRGEPQTKIVASLPIYQWLAIACVIAGAILTTIASPPAPHPHALSLAPWIAAALFGLTTYLAYGVDFPRLDRRFARLI